MLILIILIFLILITILLFLYKKNIANFFQNNQKKFFPITFFITLISIFTFYNLNKSNKIKKLSKKKSNELDNKLNKNLFYCKDCELEKFTIELIEPVQKFLQSYNLEDFYVENNIFNSFDEKIYLKLKDKILNNDLCNYSLNELSLKDINDLRDIFLNLLEFDLKIKQILNKYICLKLSKNDEFKNLYFQNEIEKKKKFRDFEKEINNFIENEFNKLN